MDRLVVIWKAWQESSSAKTPAYRIFASMCKDVVTKELEKIGASELKFNVGHYYISVFFKVEGKCLYFCTEDIRSRNPRGYWRTAKDYRDFVGGSNNWVSFENGMFMKIK